MDATTHGGESMVVYDTVSVSEIISDDVCVGGVVEGVGSLVEEMFISANS